MSKKQQHAMKRSEAAGLIEEVRKAVANASASNSPEGNAAMLSRLTDELARARVPPLEPCAGEAHGNAHIDSCSGCAPRWGWTGPFVWIR